MFDSMAKQLELQTLGKNSTFNISQKEFEDFQKEYIFESLKGIKMGVAFCAKYKVTNHILEMLGNDNAKNHIQKFYVK
jgi:ribosome-associated toxin RatA of RatAB toxin-antitoxin module